jgi:hypothetical protein
MLEKQQTGTTTTQTLDYDLTKLVGVKSVELEKYNQTTINIENVVLKKNIITNNGVMEDSLYLEISSNSLNDTDLRARTFISVWLDENNNVCYSKNLNSNSMKFLNFFGITNFNEAIGKKTIALVKLNNSGKKKLDIHFGQ